MVFKDLKQGADKAVEVFLIKVRRHFLSATRKNTASREHLNMEPSVKQWRDLTIQQSRELWWGTWMLTKNLI